ncbi:hypothetical protein CV093_16415 [Oceanobacillus sp. 143]|nr:hypothetical protein CV093_16415 [Oceanobacillus sp. 143]
MILLTKEIATAIVRETSLRIDRNVNIMDINGVIIATMEPSRMDTIHEGAVEVLRSGRTLKIFQNESEGGMEVSQGLIFQSFLEKNNRCYWYYWKSRNDGRYWRIS